VLPYGCKTWVLLQADERQHKHVEALHMSCQRRIHVTWWHHFVTNTAVLVQTEEESIRECLASNDASWQCSATYINFQNKFPPTPPRVWLSTLGLVASLTTDSSGDVREQDFATNTSDRFRTIYWCRIGHLTIAVGEECNDSRWLCAQSDVTLV